MDIRDAERRIESMQHRSLEKSKEMASMFSDDPALNALERNLARRNEISDAKRNVEIESVFFADLDEDRSEPLRFRS